MLYILHAPVYGQAASVYIMDEGTLKTPSPKCHLYWSVLCLGWGSDFVGSESGQRQSVQLLQNTVWSTTQLNTCHPPPPSHSHTLSVYTVHLVWEGGGRS
jgi:hypothetical protein